jgi:hypothetical protein
VLVAAAGCPGFSGASHAIHRGRRRQVRLTNTTVSKRIGTLQGKSGQSICPRSAGHNLIERFKQLLCHPPSRKADRRRHSAWNRGCSNHARYDGGCKARHANEQLVIARAYCYSINGEHVRTNTAAKQAPDLGSQLKCRPATDPVFRRPSARSSWPWLKRQKFSGTKFRPRNEA